MKRLIITTFCFLISITAFSQTPEEMEAWQAYMTPGENHKLLASVSGEWDAVVKMWMDPNGPPQESKATTKNHMIMDGLYQRSQHTGNMMGRPFNGESITAYDNNKKRFIATWIDNLGSGILIMEGTYDTKSNAITMQGDMIDPISGNEIPVRHVLTFNNENTHTIEMYMVMGDTEMKTMEITYTRKN